MKGGLGRLFRFCRRNPPISVQQAALARRTLRAASMLRRSQRSATPLSVLSRANRLVHAPRPTLEPAMKKGFYTIIAAQFVSSLADNALLIAAIAMLTVIKSASWITPLLQIFFTISYVLLAPFVGAFADALQKRHVMFISNALKAAGCAMMIAGVHPMIAYGIVGLGAAAYSPAKYGILTELLPPEKLIVANAWLESATVGSTILGTVIGGALVSQYVERNG